MRLIVITGTPGSGKTTIANAVASRIKGAELVHANDLIRSKHLFSSYSKDGAMVVKLGALRKEIGRLRRSSRSRVLIIEGHVLCDISIPGATAIVVREHLSRIRERLARRGYSKKKINGNLVSEAIDYCGVNSLINYERTVELMNSRASISRIAGIVNGGRVPKVRQIDLLPELARLMKKEKMNVI